MRYFLLSQINVVVADAAESADSSNSSMTNFVWIFLIIGLSIFVLMTTWRRVRRSQQHDGLTVQERVSNAMPKVDGVYNQINDLMTELADLSRQINGQIDTRIAKLDLLSAQADETISRLQKLLEQTQANAFSGVTPVSNSIATQPARQNNAPIPEPNRSPIENQETKDVLNWADQGRSAVSIAQELNRPVGEIELILALNKK